MGLDVGRETWPTFILRVESCRVQLVIYPKATLLNFLRLPLNEAIKGLDAVCQLRAFLGAGVTIDSHHLTWESLLKFNYFHLTGVTYGNNDESSQ